MVLLYGRKVIEREVEIGGKKYGIFFPISSYEPATGIGPLEIKGEISQRMASIIAEECGVMKTTENFGGASSGDPADRRDIFLAKGKGKDVEDKLITAVMMLEVQLSSAAQHLCGV